MENNQRRGQLAKSVTNIVTQFLNLACHELLYLLQIHDKEYFTSKRHGDVTVHVNKHHGIQDYINESVSKAMELFVLERSKAFVFVVVDAETEEPIERYLFHMQMYRQQITSIRNAQEQLNELLLKIGFELGSDSAKDHRERTFRCLVITNPEISNNDDVLKTDAAWQQLLKTQYDIDSNRKQIVPLGNADVGMVDIMLELQEKSNFT